MRGGDSGRIVKPGDAAGSELFQRITGADDDIRMPPKGDALSKAQIVALEKWVQLGAIPLDSPVLVEAAEDPANIDPAFMGVGAGNSEQRLINRRAARLIAAVHLILSASAALAAGMALPGAMARGDARQAGVVLRT